jgi:transcriptional regulator of aromatic amino acid metabolism
MRIAVHTGDRPGMLHQLTSALFDESANIRSLEAKTNLDHDGALVEMTVDVRDKKQLEKLVASMRRISGVRDVERLLHGCRWSDIEATAALVMLPHTGPGHIAISKSKGIKLDWKDGHQSEYGIAYLHDKCRCAS